MSKQEEIETVKKALEAENTLVDTTTEQLNIVATNLEAVLYGDEKSLATLKTVIETAVTLGAHAARVQFMQDWLEDIREKDDEEENTGPVFEVFGRVDEGKGQD